MSRDSVVPEGVDVFEDPVAELVRRGVELRVLPSLAGAGSLSRDAAEVFGPLFPYRFREVTPQ